MLAERHGVTAPAAATPSNVAATCRREPHRAPVVLARSRALLRVDDRRQGHPLAHAARSGRTRGAHPSDIKRRFTKRSPILWRLTAPANSFAACWSIPSSNPPASPAAAVIVPDGALHGLNFETLPAPGTPRRYWIHDVELQVAPSLALLGRPRESPPARSLLVVGNPTPRNPDFPALRYASAEMSSIVRHFGGQSSRTYEGAQASPDEFRSARPSSSRSFISQLTRPRTARARSTPP